MQQEGLGKEPIFRGKCAFINVCKYKDFIGRLVHVYLCMCVYENGCLQMCAYKCAYMYIYMCMYVFMCICMHVACVCVCFVFVCLHVYNT